MPAPTPTKDTKPEFKVPAGKTAILLLPVDAKEREHVEDQLSELGLSPEDLPKIATDNQIKMNKLTSQHVIFTAVCVVTSLGFKKLPSKRRLKLSPPIDCSRFTNLNSNEDEYASQVYHPGLIDEIQKHVHPFVARASKDKILKVETV